jgi:asparagine synthase (glutamine-hydrolysing)
VGGFYLLREPDAGRRQRRRQLIESSFGAQGFGSVLHIESGSLCLGVYPRPGGDGCQVFRRGNRFCVVVGTAICEGAVGVSAAEAILGHTVAASPDWRRLIGQFAVLLGDGEQLCLFGDPLGVYKLYRDRDATVFSSSFLALASAAGPCRANAQGVFEYVFQEATYGADTVLEEVLLAEAGGVHHLGRDWSFRPWPAPEVPDPEPASIQSHAERCVNRLREIFGDVALAFGDRVDTALSGGYDSRLILAMLRDQGLSPSVHVYGQASDADVQVAKRIADGERFHLEHVDKSGTEMLSVAAFAEQVERNRLAFDGYPGAGILEGAADLKTREERAEHGQLALNGGGGEIFRNFFYLLQGRYSARQLIWAFYNRYDPAMCQRRFDESRYLDALEAKVRSVVARPRGALRRTEVEYLYPAFRCRFWMGRNASINNRIGWALTPFMDPELVRTALAVPLAHKNHGRLEAAMIRHVAPRLAAYPSDYGHAFDGPVPAKRIVKDYLTLLRPPSLRRFTYRLRHAKARPREGYLADSYVQAVLPRGFERLSRFFRVDRVHDPLAYSRICTLEYVFDRLAVDVAET